MEEFRNDTQKCDVDMSPFILDDLQLAAELGKTLLERNKELEILLKEHKTKMEEQDREIMHLRKQINAMSEVNDSRLRVYEQLEVGIQELEHSNHRLNVEKTQNKKQIKLLTANVESLETRCEELSKQLDESKQTLSAERRKNEKVLQERRTALQQHSYKDLTPKKPTTPNANGNEHEQSRFDESLMTAENLSFALEERNNANSTGVNESTVQNDNSVVLPSEGSLNEGRGIVSTGEDNEELLKLISELESTKRALNSEQRRFGELEEQLVVIIQENQALQGRLLQNSTNEETMSIHDELSLLDDVQQELMCSRCLRAVEKRAANNDELLSVAQTEDAEEDDERSFLELESQRDNDQGSEFSSVTGASRAGASTNRSSVAVDLSNAPNPYRDLVEKYEALLQVQRSSIPPNSVGPRNENTLADEFKVSAQLNQTPSASGSSPQTATAENEGKPTKNVRRTPTEFSEAETSSSGFMDETSNKYTQTDERPGFFLCSIGDGENCKFSIYDDASPIDSHFRDRPEYRELFKEIFGVLKKAADNKEEGENLPLLDDNKAAMLNVKVPPVTPANEELPCDFGDDTESIISSVVSEQSIAMSECITKLERKTAKKQINESKNQGNNRPSAISFANVTEASPSRAYKPGMQQIIENGRVLTPLKREPLEYLTVGVGVKKKNRRKNRGLNSGGDRVSSPLALPPSPRVGQIGSNGPNNSRRTRKDFIPLPADILAPGPSRLGGIPRHMGAAGDWNGSSMIVYNKNLNPSRAIRSREFEVNGIEYRFNTVSQELHKLKKLDLSYAEVLRRADPCDHQKSQKRGPVPRQHNRRRNGNNGSSNPNV
ncbi:cerebellar degeneration-related protein 2-like [Scaptodrosophila lebanonensis]|uniref:Cerebellar degeneration-related protein 2-like n=1 Tax=Drosophila lebanonensis TaxID=7225 RepID=A0A6J2U9S6_DROLE|nr:cerebellar degeneration-related protein 2-like [Scaptodrosophila lebanonensis]